MSVKNINFDNKNIKKVTFTKNKKVFQIDNIDVISSANDRLC